MYRLTRVKKKMKMLSPLMNPINPAGYQVLVQEDKEDKLIKLVNSNKKT
jgi:hypothetical protein